MSGFIRRYENFPGVEVLSQIEGVVVIDSPPPGAIQGAGTGVAAVVGEFADFTRAIEADNTGAITTKAQPTQVFGAQDFVQKFGNFDPTLGDFGGSGGNGFAEIAGKKFSQLVVVPVNLASAFGVRLVRQLPTNMGASNPTPAVAMAALTVQAPTEFKTSGGLRVKHGARFTFKDSDAIRTGTDGTVAAVSGSATAGSVASGTGPFDFRGLGAGEIVVAFEAGGDQTFNITKGSAIQAGAGAAYPCTATITLNVNNGNDQVITVTTAANAADMANQINSQLYDAFAVVNGTNVDIKSDRQGTGAEVDITAVNNSVGTSGFSIAVQTGTGTVADSSAVTAAELATIIDGPLTNGTCTAASGILTFASATTGVLSTAQVKSTSTAGARMGGQFATNAVGTGTAAGAGGGTALAFASASGDFLNTDDPVYVGDVMVVGVIDGAGALDSNAGTYRIRSVDSATGLTLEQMDGTSFNWTTSSVMPYRIHHGDCADSGGRYHVGQGGGFRLPARPIDNTIAAAQVVPPTSAADAPTGNSWDPAAGLQLLTHPSGGLPYTGTVQAPNAVAASAIDTLYVTAIDALNSESDPASGVNLVHAARTSSTIRSTLKSSVLEHAKTGNGRIALVWPPLDEVDPLNVIGDVAPGVGATRDERVLYCWPHAQQYVAEAVGVQIEGADGNGHDDGLVDVSAASFLLSGLSQLAPERNPGQSSEPMKSTMAAVRAFGRGTPSLNMNAYILFKSKGIVALRYDKTAGYVFQSGITSSLTSGRKNINRRRFADFVQDSVSSRLVTWAKEPLTEAFKTGTYQEVVNFLEQLLSKNNQRAQRIVDYSVDVVSGNSRDLEAQGIWVLIGKVRTLATGDTIVFQTEIGEGVVVTRAQ